MVHQFVRKRMTDHNPLIPNAHVQSVNEVDESDKRESRVNGLNIFVTNDPNTNIQFHTCHFELSIRRSNER